MSTKEDLIAWIAQINAGTNATDVGLVADELYDEQQLVLNQYLGVTRDPVNGTVSVDFDTGGLRIDVLDLIESNVLVRE
jgi:hypothetical protein